MTRCAIYIRKSREERDKPSHRLTVQREMLPAHAAAQGWAVEVYDDGHASAARGKTEDLKERGRLESDIGAGRVDLILCIELSRLSRDDSLQDYAAWLHLCGEHRVKLATPSRVLDPAQHSDWILLLLEGGFSSVEMKILTARLREGREEARRVGRWLGGVVPWPYRYDRQSKRPVLDPEQLPLFRQAMALAETQSATQIGRRLQLPFPRMHRALTEERLLFYQGRRPIPGGIVPGEWEPCLDPGQAGRIRANRQRIAERHPEGHRYRGTSLLTCLGLFRCACGAGIQSARHRNAHRAPYYFCGQNQRGTACRQSRSILQAHVDPLVTGHLLATLADLDALRAAWIARQGETDHGQQLRLLGERERDLAAKKGRLVDAIAEGVISHADAKTALQQIDAERLAGARQAEELRRLAAPPDWQSLTFTPDEFAALDLPERRELLTLTLRTITLHHHHLTLDYLFPLHADGTTTADIPLPPPGTRRKT